MKAGDTVICIDAEETCQLREGQTYKIRDVKWRKCYDSKAHFKYVFLEELNVPGLEHVCYSVHHFKKVSSST